MSRPGEETSDEYSVCSRLLFKAGSCRKKPYRRSPSMPSHYEPSEPDVSVCGMTSTFANIRYYSRWRSASMACSTTETTLWYRRTGGNGVSTPVIIIGFVITVIIHDFLRYVSRSSPRRQSLPRLDGLTGTTRASPGIDRCPTAHLVARRRFG